MLVEKENISKGYCPNAPQCQSEEYDLHVRNKYHEFWNPWKHMLSLSYGTSFVENIHTEPGYDFPTLISEIGGTIGFLMGFNGLYFIEFFLTSICKKEAFLKRARHLSVLIMWLLFVYWSTLSVLKRLEEPISTNLEIRGNDIKSEFPMVTFCPKDIAPGLLQNFESEEESFAVPSFLSSMEKAMKEFYPFLAVQYYIDEQFYFEVDGLFEKLIVDNGGVKHELKNSDIWSSAYHASFGFCWTLDIRQEGNLNLVNGPMTLEFKIASGAIFNSQSLMFLLHNKDDLSSATHHSSLLEVNLASSMASEFVFEKTNIMVESTNHTPCSDVFPQTCQDIKLNLIIAEKYNCTVPFFKFGQHVSINETFPICGYDEMLESFNIRREVAKQCPTYMPCRFSSYKEILQDGYGFPIWEQSQGHIILRMSNLVTNHTSFVNYEFENLVYDIAGTMGMFLGWSIFSLCGLIILKLESKLIRKCLKWALDIALLLLFLIWSQDVVEKYKTQLEDMEIQIDKQLSVPQLTMCPFIAFRDTLLEAFPCSHNHVHFFEAIDNCLLTEPMLMDWLNDFHHPFLYHPIKKIVFVSDNGTHDLEGFVMEKVFHERYGICFNVDTTVLWKRYLLV